MAAASSSPPIARGSAERLRTLLRDHGVARAAVIERWEDFAPVAARQVGARGAGDRARLSLRRDAALVTEQDILGDRLARPPRRRANYQDFVAEVAALAPGDLVVHAEHGIGRYDGLVTLDVAGAPHDCLRVIYAGDDKLFVPVENIEVLSRYGSENLEVPLDRLGGVAWQSRKARVKKRIRDIAGELIAHRRRAPAAPGRDRCRRPRGSTRNSPRAFPIPRPRTRSAPSPIRWRDLASGRPMDRLICGDVGFGKTEVALRAAFIAAMAGTQVAVVVPTTLLGAPAFPHLRRALRRAAGADRAALAPGPAEARRPRSRRSSPRAASTSSSARMRCSPRASRSSHLGLLVIDEEQHFGVAQKERLKQLKANVHVLTLTATPIPRTLQHGARPACAR